MKPLLTLTLTLLLLLAAGLARANPIADALIDKTSEDCRVSIGADRALVSCTVGYHVFGASDAELYVQVPVFLPDTTPFDQEAIKRLFGALIVYDGHSYPAAHVIPDNAITPPVGTKCVTFDFVLPKPKSTDFPLTVRYLQPLINHVFYYYPQFEFGPTKRDPKKFIFAANPAAQDLSLQLTSSPANPLENSATRIKLFPNHGELIAITLKN